METAELNSLIPPEVMADTLVVAECVAAGKRVPPDVATSAWRCHALHSCFQSAGQIIPADSVRGWLRHAAANRHAAHDGRRTLPRRRPRGCRLQGPRSGRVFLLRRGQRRRLRHDGESAGTGLRVARAPGGRPLDRGAAGPQVPDADAEHAPGA